MVAYRDCKGHLVCMADAQTGIVEIQHKDRALRMTCLLYTSDAADEL